MPFILFRCYLYAIPSDTTLNDKLPTALQRDLDHLNMAGSLRKLSDVEENEKCPLIHSNNAGRKILVESKKIWSIAGPAVFIRVAMYGMNVITQAFAGHLGDLELAAISIASTVIVGLTYGLFLGLASALGTLCGQAYGAKQYHMLGIYLQRSWIVLFVGAVLILPLYMYVTPILKLMGQPDDIAELTGSVSIWFIPQHFAFVWSFPLQRYLQSQSKHMVITWLAAAILVLHIGLNWIFITQMDLGLVGAAITLDISWWVYAIAQFLYVTCGGCPETWTGLSRKAFNELWPFAKLSIASGVMLWLEYWYYRILVLLTGNLADEQVAVDSISICMSISAWEMRIPIGFLVAIGVRVANELGAGNSEGAKFAVKVSVSTSTAIGIVFSVLIFVFHQEFALMFTTSLAIREAVSRLAILLGFTVLLNSVQPVLSGVAIGTGWQSYVAWVNIGCYYFIGIPLGLLLGWVYNLGVLGIWTGMICGTAMQTLALAYLIYRCDWEGEVAKAIERVKARSSSSDQSVQIKLEEWKGDDFHSENGA